MPDTTAESLENSPPGAPEPRSASRNAPRHAGDWSIPDDHNAYATETIEEDPFTDPKGYLDDFVIGEELLQALEKAEQAQANGEPTPDNMPFAPVSPVAEEREYHPLEMVLFQDIEQHTAPLQSDTGVSAQSPQSPATSGAWFEIKPGDTYLPFEPVDDPETPALEDQQVQPITILNERIFQDWAQLEKIGESGNPEQIFDFKTLRAKLTLDFGLTEENTNRIQALMNQCILRGDLERMKVLNQVKHDLYETQKIIRKLRAEYFPESVPKTEATVNGPAAELEAVETIDVPEYQPVRFEQRKAKVEKKTLIEIQAGILETVFNGKHTLVFKCAFLALLMAMIPYVYFQTASNRPKKEKVDAEMYASIMPLKKAYRLGDSLIAQVDPGWAMIATKSRKEQVEDLVERTKREGYQMVAITYPDGAPAANFILGRVLIF